MHPPSHPSGEPLLPPLEDEGYDTLHANAILAIQRAVKQHNAEMVSVIGETIRWLVQLRNLRETFRNTDKIYGTSGITPLCGITPSRVYQLLDEEFLVTREELRQDDLEFRSLISSESRLGKAIQEMETFIYETEDALEPSL